MRCVGWSSGQGTWSLESGSAWWRGGRSGSGAAAVIEGEAVDGVPADPTLKLQSHCMQSKVYTKTALHSLHAKYKLYNVGGLNPHSSNFTLQLLTMHSKCSVHCIQHGVVHYTIHNGHCTMPSDAVLSCSQHHVGNMTACKR